MDWLKGEEKKLKKLKSDGVPIKDIMKILDRSYWSVVNKSSRTKSGRTHRIWEEGEFELVKALHNEGLTYEQIGKELGRSKKSIQGKFDEKRRLKNEIKI